MAERKTRADKGLSKRLSKPERQTIVEVRQQVHKASKRS